jgi:hypothetical protein
MRKTRTTGAVGDSNAGATLVTGKNDNLLPSYGR